MDVSIKRQEGRQRMGSAGFVANPFLTGELRQLVPSTDCEQAEAVASGELLLETLPPSQFTFRPDGLRFQAIASAELLAQLFPSDDSSEFMPLGIATNFGEGGKVTLHLLRRFANLPHILFFGRLRYLDPHHGTQMTEFIPTGFATSFGQEGKVTLALLTRLANLPHVLCFGRLRSDFLQLPE